MRVNRVKKKNVPCLIRGVFSSDVDLYERRYHGEDKSLEGLVAYFMETLYEKGDLTDIIIYSYGEVETEGFFAIHRRERVLRSFGIKKEYRQGGVNDNFWAAVRRKLGASFYAAIWDGNRNAHRFFVNKGGILLKNESNCSFYKFNEICQYQQQY